MKSLHYFLIKPLALSALAFGFSLAHADPELVDHDAKLRVVSATGGITEIIYALGSHDQLIAVDTSSQYPPEATELPNIGYMRALSPEGVIAMRPDIVLITDDVGPKPVLELIKAAGVPIQQVNSDDSVEGLQQRIQQIGLLLNHEQQANQLRQQIEQEYITFIEQRDQRLEQLSASPSVLFVLSHGGHSPMSAGKGTAAHAMIELVGANNVAADYFGYKALGKEALHALAPQVIITTSQGVEKMGSKEALLNALGLSDAAHQPRIITMDAGLLMSFGPRTLAAARELLDQLTHRDDVAHRR